MRIPIFAAVLLVTFSVLIDFYIYGSICRAKGKKSVWSWGYLVSSLLFWIFLIVVLLLPRRNADDSIHSVMWMLYSYISIYVVKILYVIFSAVGLFGFVKGKRPWRTGIYIGLPLGLICFVIMWYGATIGRSKLQVTRVVVESPKLPEAFNGYRIVQFSDAHVGTWGNDTVFVSRMIDTINALHPDVIFFTGDVVNRRTSEIEPFVSILSRLHAPDGVYSILGNHDYGDYIDWQNKDLKDANMQQMYQVQKEMGWKLLDNSHDFLVKGNDTIPVIGVGNWGEPPFKQYGNLKKAYPESPDSSFNVNDNRFKILLSHNPEHWNQHVSKETNIDLTLSGHTHAMQFLIKLGSFKWSPAQYIYKQWGGLYERLTQDGKPIRIYVNIGSGEVGMPYRIGAISEITEITLKCTEGK
ncbi:MAG: metallophosphoesterase [Prevotella sp.]|nr:metallophosphoesterase [Bacteroides sp.]MCM1366638.1 metallophosphoesterase [Prevotella sp.]MCM1437003.1 metallophosphoesterase [Prevotella sp.]